MSERRRFYFTYGESENQPYVRGWTVVEAETLKDAKKAYIAYHPLTSEGFIPCAGIYLEEEFKETVMYRTEELREKIYVNNTARVPYRRKIVESQPKLQTEQTSQQNRELKIMLLCELFSKLSKDDQNEVIAVTEKYLEKA